jgi:hypothetical protein
MFIRTREIKRRELRGRPIKRYARPSGRAGESNDAKD